MTDREQVWADMAQRFPDFKPEYDVADNHHAIREIVLGGSPPWAGVHQRYQPAKGHFVLDIGANTGVFSIFCALHGALVYALEPHPKAFSLLCQATRTLPEVCPYQAAVWTKNELLPFLGHETTFAEDQTRHFNGSVASNGINWNTHDLQQTKMVQAWSLDYLLHGKVDMLKMDIEGAECEVLLAASENSLRRIRFMYLELHPWVSQELYEATLEKLQRVFNFEGAYFNPQIKRWEGVYCHAKS